MSILSSAVSELEKIFPPLDKYTKKKKKDSPWLIAAKVAGVLVALILIPALLLLLGLIVLAYVGAVDGVDPEG